MTELSTSRGASTKASLEASRIAAQFAGVAGNTDPFVAAVLATPMPMIITDPRQHDNPVVFANDAFCSFTGYSRAEILGRNCRLLQGAETDPETVARIRAALGEAREIEVDIRNYRKSGESFWNRLLVAPVYDADGALSYFVASQADVTAERERRDTSVRREAAPRAEPAASPHEQREDRENELRFALEAGRFGAWTLDLTTGTLSASPAFKENYGRDSDKPFTFADLRAAIHPEDCGRVDAALAESMTQGGDYNIDHRCIAPAGDIRWVGMRGRPIYAADRRPLRMSGVSIDLTEQKRADRLRQALVELGGLFRNSQDPGELSFAAGQVLGMTLGVTRAGFGEVDAATDTIVVLRDWTAPFVATLAGAAHLRDYGSFVDDLKRGDTVVVSNAAIDPRTAGSATSLEAAAVQAMINVPIIEQGRLVALTFVNNAVPRIWHDDEVRFVQEVAERTRAAAERRRAEQNLANLAASLEQQVAQRTHELLNAEEALRQSQKMEAIGQLTGGVAHDFNNLLTVIRSSVDLMRRPNLSEERRRRYIDAIADTVNRAAKLTGQLLAFARRQALKPEAFDLRERLAGIADMLDAVTGARIRVITQLPDEACFVRADISQFETALVNMAVNARDAMDGEGALTLRLVQTDAMPAIRGHAGTTGRFAAVSITDTGEGIATGDLVRIFEPFFTTKGIGKGTGLGLSQVFGFAKQSGGDVDVMSEAGRGATFTLYLPQIELVDPEKTEGLARPGLAPGGGGRRVLLVEDNVEVGRFSTQVLQDLGYKTIWAMTAADALSKLDGGTIVDVVFSDVVMPGMSGIEMAKQIRNSHPDLPVVLTSGYSHVLAEEGAHGFELLHKPYSAEQLSTILRRATAGRRSRSD
ncbi:PAS domain-containing protein [Lichenifustis flavocetrariae]|uniref:histidine kinase n=1 Tax=Lichenifustis flavocetrariae TaxID=2949735 RepID=A0AA41YWJ1_9HYPH|nr:PAS domain-containing protein [Lichenifustis flavocetrariae]MCW6508610.1 PAS domain-containing protein [Lichenifustis flavocetrariae]